MAPSYNTDREQFVNTSDGVIGVNVFSAKGDPDAIALQPGETVYLTEAEQRMTAEAPKLPEDNPLTNGKLKPLAEQRPLRPVEDEEATLAAKAALEAEEAAKAQEAAEIEAKAREAEIAKEPAAQVEETGAPPLPASEAPEGSFAQGEEVATPDAQAEADDTPRGDGGRFVSPSDSDEG